MWTHYAQDRSWSARLQSSTFSSLVAARHYFIWKAITHPSEGHNSSIQSAIEVNEYLMESLFSKISNRIDITSISHQQDLQIIKTRADISIEYYDIVVGLAINHRWDLGPSGSTPQPCGEHLKYVQECTSSLPPP
ncbi:hypothetical protein BDA96_06G021800 [Sorghum bicolor]|uniref:Uncharacterized protein n=1 Tax=Sorghum bicolor TaxID=4558 RepID=A0A921QNN3_SORBI|nr:hypothetical protein BDA96_06G021800 [Sorghum bicolor]